jgi:hypothetical protein
MGVPFQCLHNVYTKKFRFQPKCTHIRQIVTDSDYTYEVISSYNIKSFSDYSFLPLEVFEKQCFCKYITIVGKPKGTYDVLKWTVSWVQCLSLVVGLWFWLYSLSFCRTTWIFNGAHSVLERQWENCATRKGYLQDTCRHLLWAPKLRFCIYQYYFNWMCLIS